MKNNPLDRKLRKLVAELEAAGVDPCTCVPELARKVKQPPGNVRHYVNKFALEKIRAKGGGR